MSWFSTPSKLRRSVASQFPSHQASASSSGKGGSHTLTDLHAAVCSLAHRRGNPARTPKRLGPRDPLRAKADSPKCFALRARAKAEATKEHSKEEQVPATAACYCHCHGRAKVVYAGANQSWECGPRVMVQSDCFTALICPRTRAQISGLKPARKARNSRHDERRTPNPKPVSAS